MNALVPIRAASGPAIDLSPDGSGVWSAEAPPVGLQAMGRVLRVRPWTLKQVDGRWAIVGDMGMVVPAPDLGWIVRLDQWTPVGGRRWNNRDAACEVIWGFSWTLEAEDAVTWLLFQGKPNRDQAKAIRVAIRAAEDGSLPYVV